jgi:tRNA(Ile)-lysidine synthase
VIDELLHRCSFPPAGTPIVCALSGGPDSTALVALAVAAQCEVTAIHVHHGLRPSADFDAECARRTSDRLAVAFRVERVDVADGPNLEARARAARRQVLGTRVLTGHTLDDQAETVLLALMRGSGANGLAAMTPGATRPILRLRRSDTVALCIDQGLETADDPTNDDPRFRRNRVRHELLPLIHTIAERDVAPILARTADLLRADDALLEQLAERIDVTDARVLAGSPVPLARRSVRRWLDREGYPPDAATVARVLDVASGRSAACDAGGGRRVERHQQRLILVNIADPAS